MALNLMRRFVLLAAPALLLGGCTTGAVWEEGQFARFHEPAVPSNLSLYHSPEAQDILVVYNECREGKDAAWPRAYWLYRSGERIQQGRKPRFVSVKIAQGLTPIPIAESADVPVQSEAAALYAVASTNAPGFTLHSAEKELGYHQFPVYADSSGRVKQVLLTPVAVVVDLTIVDGVIVYVTMPMWWESLNCVH
jgi:hypothetical protein